MDGDKDALMSRVKNYYHEEIIRRDTGLDDYQADIHFQHEEKKMIYRQLHLALERVVNNVRRELAEANLGNMRLDIEVSGRTEAGDVLITYRLGDRYDRNIPSGGDLEAVVAEHLRRSGWIKKNAPVLLSSPNSFAENTDA